MAKLSGSEAVGDSQSAGDSQHLVVKNTFLEVQCRHEDLNPEIRPRARSWSSEGSGDLDRDDLDGVESSQRGRASTNGAGAALFEEASATQIELQDPMPQCFVADPATAGGYLVDSSCRDPLAEQVSETFCRGRSIAVKNTFLQIDCKPFDLDYDIKPRSRSWSSDGDAGDERRGRSDSSGSVRRLRLFSEGTAVSKVEHPAAQRSTASGKPLGKFGKTPGGETSSLLARRALAERNAEGADADQSFVIKKTFLELKCRPEDLNAGAKYRAKSWSSDGSDAGDNYAGIEGGVISLDAGASAAEVVRPRPQTVQAPEVSSCLSGGLPAAKVPCLMETRTLPAPPGLVQAMQGAAPGAARGEPNGEPRAGAAAQRLECAKARLAAAQDEARLALTEVSAIRIYQNPSVDVAACTTVMLRSLPKRSTRAMLLAALNSKGFAGLYDFVCLPVDFQRNTAFGYSFVNFICPEVAQRAMCCFDGFCHWPVHGARASAAVWSSPLQGLEALVARFRDSPVMHESVPEEHRPLILDSRGATIPFPPPQRRIRVPRCSREFVARKARGS